MKEKCELLEYLHRDANMGVYATKRILEILKDKDNKIKGLLEEILDEYKEYSADSSKELENYCIEPESEGLFCKIWSNIEMMKDVKKDNSDSHIADMMIKGITIGKLEMEKRINDDKKDKDVDKDHKKLAKKYLKFQDKTIDKLKKYL